MGRDGGVHLGELVRYADDFVVMSRRARDCDEAQARIEHVLGLRADQAQRWDPEYFEQLGVYRRRGTIRYAGQAFWKQETA